MNVLVLRFSAMGDVIMAVPVIHSLLEENPELKITFVSRPFFKPLFQFSDRLTFIGVDLKNEYKGVLGLRKLALKLNKENNFDTVIDLHDVLRTKIIRSILKLKGLKTLVFEKGRKEKEALLNSTEFRKLKHTTDRYATPFKTLSLKLSIEQKSYVNSTLSNSVDSFLTELKSSKYIIGIAPFAAHQSKEWGVKKIEQLISELSKNENIKILLFGGGEKEISTLNKIESKFDHCISVAGKFSFKDEISLISQLSVMVSMDSANMHLATICNTPVVSIWGPTHHFLGFGPLFNENNIVEISKSKLPCRPCSIYGKINSQIQQECANKSMEMISVDMVLSKLNSILK